MMDFTARKPPIGKRMKCQAPPPPLAPEPAPRRIFRNSVPDGGGSLQGSMGSMVGDTKENITRGVKLRITLPQGNQTRSTVAGSKALMDLLVDLCSQYHLNPAYHTMELQSSQALPLAFKPNALLGTLDVAAVIIREKVWEEKVVRKPLPKVPEKTVRLVVNYHRGQKTVLRVSPLVPLDSLVPAICEKCEFNPAHVLLLKDNVSNHELELDKTLSELGVRELYVMDQTLEFYRPNTSAVSEAEKKGLLGFFKFNRRKSKTEDQSSVDMEVLHDNVIQNIEKYSNGQSTPSMGPCVDARPSTLGQSQSVMNISRMSPRMEPKKRRAPAPPATTPCQGRYTLDAYEVAPDSESTLRKRKAPAPPPPPSPSTPMPQSPVQLPPCPAPSSPGLSLPAEDDSCSELSHSLDDSEPSGSVCSSSSSSMAAAADTSMADTDSASSRPDVSKPSPDSASSRPDVSKPSPDSASSSSAGMAKASGDSSSSKIYSAPRGKKDVVNTTPDSVLQIEQVDSMPRCRAAKSKPESSCSTTPTETRGESALGLKLDETENNRHSAMAWLHHQRVSMETPLTPGLEVVETLSTGSSSSGSLQDYGYAASEGMTEAEESGLLDTHVIQTHPTSPTSILSREGSGLSPPMVHPLIKDCSSDSDEGCATWESRHRPSTYSSHKVNAVKTKDIYEKDQELTKQLDQTLADLESDPTDIFTVSVQEHPYVLSTNSNDIPVSVVDTEVPVTAIDEVMEDYKTQSMTEHQATLMSSFQVTDNKAHNHRHPQSSVGDIENKNNNACTSEGSSQVCPGQQPQPMHRLRAPMKKLTNGATEKESEIVSKSNSKVEVQSQKKSTAGAEKKASTVLNLPESHFHPTEKEEQVAPFRGKSALQAQTKITHNPVSRFGTKTFTIVPHKPAVVSQQQQADTAVTTLTAGAIRIDEQGNMVRVGITRNKFGGSAESDINKEDSFSPLHGKAKAFWSSTDKQDTSAPSVPTIRVTVTKCTEPEVHKPLSPITDSKPPMANATPKAFKPVAKMSPEERYKDVEIIKNVSHQADSKATAPASDLPVRQQPTKLTSNTLHDQTRDLSFLKPSRRTSSQYVASAIAKHTVKPTVAKADTIREVAKSSGTVRMLPGSYCNHKEGLSFHVNPLRSSSTSANVSVNEGSVSGSNPTGLRSAVGYPDYLSGENRGVFVRSGNGSSTTIQDKGKSSTVLYSDIADDKLDRSNSSRQKTPVASQFPTKQLPDVSKLSLDPSPLPAQSRRESIDPVSHPSVAASSKNPFEQPQVSVFGPVKKFKPVIMKSAQTDMSLHTTLMSAIQSGDGKERLKKTTDSIASSTLKKLSFVEEENERCALLAAIRGQSHSARLKKTKSQAAEELDKFRMTELDENRTQCAASPAIPPPPSFMPPPPPPTSMLPPPSAPRSTSGVLGNPVLARDAMLEAIRSGSAAERLKKVTAPMTTVQVNSRLGTIQPASSLSQQSQ